MPILCWEHALFDDLGLTADGAADHGTDTGQTQITITDSTHPLASGHTGTLDVYDAATVTVLTPFNAFRTAHFTPAQLADPNISGPYADFDMDGHVTLLEHFFGMDPKVADQPYRMELTFIHDAGSNYGGFSFRYSLAATDVSFKVDASIDVQTWESGGDRLELIGSTDHGDGTRTVTHRSLLADQPTEFFRVTVTLN